MRAGCDRRVRLGAVNQSLVQQELTRLMKVSGSANCYTARCSFQLIIYPSPCPAENKAFALLPQDNNKKAIRAEVDIYLQYTATRSERSINRATTSHTWHTNEDQSRATIKLLKNNVNPIKPTVTTLNLYTLISYFQLFILIRMK